ncbi:unnamed protein product [Gongylonema pulchrum]|uniref:Uncharacterized protein n=1 Tax=Gongylonema pulchrum TaxID=637853 RepID=A0A183EPI0_9BILA|nr:unnamed protein product [Gongylonema pulchrum]
MGIEIVECVDSSVTSLFQREHFQVQTLSTAYPFGLDDCITAYGNISGGLLPFSMGKNPYFQAPLPRKCRKRGNRRRRKCSGDALLLMYCHLQKLAFYKVSYFSD